LATEPPSLASPSVAEPEAFQREPTLLGTLGAALPLGAAIAVFGAIYGAAAGPVLGVGGTLASSVLIFSGALQFATLGLAASGAGPLAILLTALALNLRHLVLGALLRPRLRVSTSRRAGLAWFLVDETFGLAYASRGQVARTLLLVGIVCYLSWLAGTSVGLLGTTLAPLEGVAGAIFPVLFIGLAAVTSRQLSVAARAAIAALLVVVVALTLPELRAIAPLVAALVVALPGRRA
jgi:predicted branched-subunit amino acid permease